MEENSKLQELHDRKIDLALKINELYMEIARIDAEILRRGGMVSIASAFGGTIGGTIGGTMIDKEGKIK